MLEIDDVAEVIATAVKQATDPLLVRLDQLERAANRVDVAGAFIDRDGGLILTLSDGSTRSVGPVVGKNGDNGSDGADGMSADDIDIKVLDDGRTMEFSFTQGDITHAFEIAFPFPMYRDVYKEGQTYSPGDMVTWSGALWHCNKETGEKPGPSDDWTLAVKKGRDGRDAGK